MLDVTQSERELVVTARAPVWLVALAWMFIVLAPILTGVTIYAFVGGPKTYTISCSRPTRTCHVPQGGDLDLDDLRTVEVVGSRQHGVVYELQAKLRDGKTRTISPDDAQDADAIAEYEAAARSVREFLASPEHATLDVRFRYRPSGPQLLEMVVMAVMCLGLAVVARATAVSRAAHFSPHAKTLSLVTAGPLRRATTRTIAFADIARVLDIRTTQTRSYRALAVEVNGERVHVTQSGLFARASELDAAALAIAKVLDMDVAAVAS